MATVEEQQEVEQTEQQQQQTPASSTGLDPKIGGLLAYFFGWLGGLILFVIEKDSKYIRFHAMQSILLNVAVVILFVGLGIVVTILGNIPGIGALALLALPLYGLMWLGAMILWVFMLYKGFSGYETGEMYKLPVIGDQAEKIAG